MAKMTMLKIISLSNNELEWDSCGTASGESLGVLFILKRCLRNGGIPNVYRRFGLVRSKLVLTSPTVEKGP